MKEYKYGTYIQGKQYNNEGILLYDGQFYKGKRNGKGKEYNYKNILVFEGIYENRNKWSRKGFNNIGNIETIRKNIFYKLISAILINEEDGDDLKKIWEICTIKPVCDQVECHLYKNKLEFKKQLDKENIVLVAYCPVRHIDDALKNNKDIVNIMEKYKKNIYQIVLKWHIQNGYIPIPKASNVEHMKSNFNIFDFELTSDEMKVLNSIPQKTEGDPDDETRKWVLSHPPKED